MSFLIRIGREFEIACLDFAKEIAHKMSIEMRVSVSLEIHLDKQDRLS